MREQLGIVIDGEALAIPTPDEPVLPRQSGEVPEPGGAVALRQTEIPGLPVVSRWAGLDDRAMLVLAEFPRLFKRGGLVGRELRDRVHMSGIPHSTGAGQYSLRQRGEDGRWRLVTFTIIAGATVVKSITEWSRYLPKHTEAA
jgi:hypothetical protein